MVDRASSCVSLHHLHAFACVAAAGRVRGAAASLLRGAPTVTRSVRALERSLGVVLFERRCNGMVLTAAGRSVQARMLRIESGLLQIHGEAMALRHEGPRAGVPVGVPAALLNERRLRVAWLLGQTRHMPTVARALGMSQPAVSQAIACVERALEQCLFTRTAHGMVPTGAALRWLPGFQRALGELESIGADIARLRGMAVA